MEAEVTGDCHCDSGGGKELFGVKNLETSFSFVQMPFDQRA